MKDERGRMNVEGKQVAALARSAGSSFILGLRPRPAALHRGGRSTARTCAGTFFEFLSRPSSFALCAALVGGAAIAQGLADPTRPPAGFAAGDPEATSSAAAGGPVLQSVMISASGSAAIISGEMVKLGQKYGDAVLVRVAESEVVLKSGSDMQVLKLYPGVEKRSTAPPAVKAAPRRGKKSPAAAPALEPGAGPRQGDS